QFFSGVELQDQFADLRPQLTYLALVSDLLILAARLQPAFPGGDERLHPRLALGLREIVLPAGIHELHLALDQLQQQLDLPLGRPPLKLLLHRSLRPDSGAVPCPVSEGNHLKSGRPGSNRRRPAWEAGILPLNYARGGWDSYRSGSGLARWSAS